MLQKRFMATGFTSLMILSACAQKTERIYELDDRAGYDRDLPELSIRTKKSVGPGFTRSKVVTVWLHGHEMPSGDYFMGSELRLIIKQPYWTRKRRYYTPNKKHKRTKRHRPVRESARGERIR